MNPTYAEKKEISIGNHRIPHNSKEFNQGIFELEKVLAHLNSRDHFVFQRIVDSIKSGDYKQSEMLANELCKIRLLKTKLLFAIKFFVKVSQ